MKANFGIHGNLPSDEIILEDIEEFKQMFVEGLLVNTSIRQELFQRFVKYVEEFKLYLKHDFYLLIDGSFVTKKQEPADIDFVAVVDFRDYEQQEKIIDERFSSKNARTVFGVDAYVMADYPENHKNHFFTKSDLAYWRHLFSSTKPNRANQKFAKGFVQIKFKQNG